MRRRRGYRGHSRHVKTYIHVPINAWLPYLRARMLRPGRPQVSQRPIQSDITHNGLHFTAGTHRTPSHSFSHTSLRLPSAPKGYSADTWSRLCRHRASVESRGRYQGQCFSGEARRVQSVRLIDRVVYISDRGVFGQAKGLAWRAWCTHKSANACSSSVSEVYLRIGTEHSPSCNGPMG